MRPSLLVKFKRFSHNIVRNIATTHIHRHIIEKFTKKYSMVYFGSVNQHHDEHRVIRGFTVSSTHQDNHYSVGTVDGYDIRFANRGDAVLKPNNQVVYDSWQIMAFDLHTNKDVPHIFINANNHYKVNYESLFAEYPMLIKLKLGTFEDYGLEFTSRFTVYTSLADSIEVERLLPADTTRILGVHFWPFSIEIHEGVLYVYSDDKKISSHTLDSMLENGLWLARNIDSVIESI